MSEIEKMYENAGIKPYYDYTVLKEGYDGKITFTKQAVRGKAQLFKNKKLRIIQVLPFYPDFTAEKQLELIKWLSNNNKDKNKGLTLHNSAHSYYYFALHHVPAHSEDDMWSYGEGSGTTFEEGLAKLINDLWQDLTKEERIEIAEILRTIPK